MILFFLNSPSTPLVSLADDLVLALQQRGQVEFDAGDFDAVLCQLVLVAS